MVVRRMWSATITHTTLGDHLQSFNAPQPSLQDGVVD
jgi:hypothetical protein